MLDDLDLISNENLNSLDTSRGHIFSLIFRGTCLFNQYKACCVF